MINQDLIDDPDEELKQLYSKVVALISKPKMFDFITVFMISTVVGLPQSFDHQTQTLQQHNPTPMQSLFVSVNPDPLKVVHHSYTDQNTDDISPKRGDGRRDS